MQGFKTAEASSSQLYCHHPSSLLLRGQYYPNRNQTRFSDLGELHHSIAFFQHEDALDLTSGCMYSVKSSNVVIGGSNMQYGTTNTNVGSADIGSSGAGQQLIIYQQQLQHHQHGHVDVENWADSGLVDNNNNNNNNSQHTDDTSTDIDTDDKDQCNRENSSGKHLADHHSMLRAKFRAQDHKTLRRLAQNREAARKSRLRKKAYVQQLENSRVKLLRLEQELERARQQQGMLLINTTSPTPRSSGCLRFEMEYSDWVDEHERVLNELRSALNSEKSDNELHLVIDGVMAHYDELVRIKSIGAKADVFHMLFGLWKTPVERRFMWLGGFRSSELLKIVKNQLELLTENQLMGIYNLEQSSQQAEDALTEGMKAMQQSVSEILSYNSSTSTAGIGNVDHHYMAVAMDAFAILEDFLHMADVLKQETLQELQRILTTRQMARALLVRNDFISRLRALSTLWLARPTE